MACGLHADSMPIACRLLRIYYNYSRAHHAVQVLERGQSRDYESVRDTGCPVIGRRRPPGVELRRPVRGNRAVYGFDLCTVVNGYGSTIDTRGPRGIRLRNTRPTATRAKQPWCMEATRGTTRNRDHPCPVRRGRVRAGVSWCVVRDVRYLRNLACRPRPGYGRLSVVLRLLRIIS